MKTVDLFQINFTQLMAKKVSTRAGTTTGAGTSSIYSGLNSHPSGLNLGDQSYRVPSSSGGFIPADPIKFCLRFKPPTIAIVY
jgi:hypothetical protein